MKEVEKVPPGPQQSPKCAREGVGGSRKEWVGQGRSRWDRLIAGRASSTHLSEGKSAEAEDEVVTGLAHRRA